MEKRHREILSALVDKLRHLISTNPAYDHLEEAISYEKVEHTTYTWIVRLLTLRAMEARGLIDGMLHTGVRDGRQATRIAPFYRDGSATISAGKIWWATLKRACAELAPLLPGLFTLDDALYPGTDALFACIELVSGRQAVLPGVGLEELHAIFTDPDAIGWAYQFYQAQARAEINVKCKQGGKVACRAELVAKTQLFTEPYMVQWLLQNSLGRSYSEAYPQSKLPAHWPYFIQPEPADRQPEHILPLGKRELLQPS